MDPLLRSAVNASVGWYEDMCRLHGVGSMLVDGLWSSLDPPPPLHSDAVVVEPEVSADQVLDRLDGRAHCAVKDSFSTIDPSREGMRLLFSATWIHREPAAGQPSGNAHGWSVVTSADALADWTGRHDTAEVLLPGVLRCAHVKVLAKHADHGIIAGAVVRLGSGVVDVSNVYAVPGQLVDWTELAEAVRGQFPGRPMVGFERGQELSAALAGGFVPVGDQRVWVR